MAEVPLRRIRNRYAGSPLPAIKKKKSKKNKRRRGGEKRHGKQRKVTTGKSGGKDREYLDRRAHNGKNINKPYELGNSVLSRLHKKPCKKLGEEGALQGGCDWKKLP